MEAFSC